MSTDKPLNVQTAAALGWTGFVQRGQVTDGELFNPSGFIWFGFPPGKSEIREVPAYGETWCATGPLISAYHVVFGPEYDVDDGFLVFSDKWGAKIGLDRTGKTITYGKTACEAVAKLIVKVASQGELRPV